MIRLTPPTRAGYVSSTWGASRAYRNGWHEGLDFPDSRGTPVLAAADGIVVRVDNVDNSFAGKWLAIDHGEGIVTRYLHNERNDVIRGQRVSRGQQIGLVGGTGTKSGHPHVHFDVKASAAAVADYLRQFGAPTTGFGRKGSRGRGVPAEALMSGATYKATAKKDALSRGVVFYSRPYILYAALAGAGYLLYRHLS